MAYLFPYAGAERRPAPPKLTRSNQPTHHPRRLLTPTPAAQPSEPIPEPTLSYSYDTPEYLPKSLRAILEEVCREHRVHPQDVVSSNSLAHVVQARRVFCIRAKTETDASLSKIGRVIGKDHTTVLYYVKQGEAGCSMEPRKDNSGRPKSHKGPRIHKPELTAQESRFLELETRGLSTREIAQELGTSNESVRSYRSRVKKKMKIRAAMEAQNG